MKTKDLISVLKDVVNAWEQNNSETSDTAMEINMWRKYFLKKELKPYSEAKMRSINAAFLAIPISAMSRRDPKELLKELEAEYDKQ